MKTNREKLNHRLIQVGMVVSLLFAGSFLLRLFIPWFMNQKMVEDPRLFRKVITILPSLSYIAFYLRYIRREKPLWLIKLYSLVLAGFFGMMMMDIMLFPSQGGFRPNFPSYMFLMALLCFVFSLGTFRILLVAYLVPVLLSILILSQTVKHFAYYFSFFLNHYSTILVLMGTLLILTWSISRIRNREWTLREQIQLQREKNRQWLQLNRFKDEFLQNTSNELKTPVGNVIKSAELMLKGLHKSRSLEFKENLLLILSCGKRLNHLINDILDATKLKYKKMALNLQPISLFPMVENLLLLVTPLVGGKSIRLINRVDPVTPAALGDANRIEQILLNLIGNAIKFTQSGEVGIESKVSKKMLEITVFDTGEGIDTSDQERIFQQFEQADNSLVRKHDGAGLGLTITQQLIKMHGGSIHVDSEIGIGSRFTFTLPLASVPIADVMSQEKDKNTVQVDTLVDADEMIAMDFNQKPLTNAEKKEEIEKRGDTIFHLLIVDDNPVNLAVMENQLIPEGYRITKAMNGMEALSCLDQEKPDLIVLDIMMPDMDGFQVCEKIRKKYKKSELPIIYLAARSQEASLLRGFSQGGNDYLTKPFSKNVLQARIRTQLESVTGIRRLAVLHQFSEKIAKFRTMEQLARALFETLSGDPFIRSVILIQQEEILKSKGDQAAFQLPDLKTVADFFVIEDESGWVHMKLKNQLLLSTYQQDRITKEWLKTVAAQVKKNLKVWQNIAYNPTTTQAFSTIGSELNDLLFIKSDGNYCHLYTTKEMKEIRISMKRTLLAFPDLVQVHRSYCVNSKNIRVAKKRHSSFFLQFNEHEVPIGRSWLPEVQERFPTLFN